MGAVRAGRLAEIDVLVTDAAIDARIARTLGRRGVRVIAA